MGTHAWWEEEARSSERRGHRANIGQRKYGKNIKGQKELNTQTEEP